MPTAQLTDRFCATAKPVDGKQVEHFDELVRGLSLLVSARSKAFYVHFTKPDGKRGRVKLGGYPELSLAAARQKARDTRAEVGEGKDPTAERRAAAASLTVRDLVESYLTRKASSAKRGDEIARRLRHDVVPLIGAVKLSQLHRRDVTKVIDSVMDRGAPQAANRLFDDCRALLRWARARGDLDSNLVDGLVRPAQTVARDRVLTADEIRQLWSALPSASMTESLRRVLRLLLLTGQRNGEVCGMERGELDLVAATWVIPPARSKNGREHTVPLSDLALSIIREQLADVDALAERMDREASPFVFPAPSGKAGLTNASVSKAVLRSKHLGLEPWTPHDLRRSAATHMEELGVSPHVIGCILNHVSVTRGTITSKVYARHTYAREKREALNVWAERLAGVVSGGAQIVPLFSNGGRY